MSLVVTKASEARPPWALLPVPPDHGSGTSQRSEVVSTIAPPDGLHLLPLGIGSSRGGHLALFEGRLLGVWLAQPTDREHSGERATRRCQRRMDMAILIAVHDRIGRMDTL